MDAAIKTRSLEKIAYGFYPTVGIENPSPSVGDVLNAIGVAQARGIGTPEERRDAFGRIVDSGLAATSPASTAINMIGRGVLGRAIAGIFTNNPFMKGLGAGIGAATALNMH